MAIIGGDSYDHYFNGGTGAASNAALQLKYDAVGTPSTGNPPWITPNNSDGTTGRFASNALRLTFRRGCFVEGDFVLPAPSTLGWGFALRVPAIDQSLWPVMVFRDNTLFQVSLNIRSDLHLEVWNHDASNNYSTRLGSISTNGLGGGYGYIEFKVTFHPTAGAVE